MISAGERVEMDEQTVCFCTYRDGTWQMHPQATCEQRPSPSPTPTPTPSPSPSPPEERTKQRGGRRAYSPRLDVIP